MRAQSSRANGIRLPLFALYGERAVTRGTSAGHSLPALYARTRASDNAMGTSRLRCLRRDVAAAMMLLVSGATATVRRYASHPMLGRLIQPRSGNDIGEIASCGMRWAADNDCFQGLNERAYTAMLNQFALVDRSRLLFVTAPDVVADKRATLALFASWQSRLEMRQLPIAFVAQDELVPDEVPWLSIDALFIGGSTAWKLSHAVDWLIASAQQRGVWVHIGRVNSRRRLSHFDAIGADSFDGTQFSMYPDTYIPRCLARLEYHQHPLGGSDDTNQATSLRAVSCRADE